jgi:cytidine deaminase
MAIRLTKEERKLIDHAKKMVVKYNNQRNARGELATIYAFVLSDSGKIYEGACMESTIGSGRVCAERVAISSMFTKETYASKIACVVTFDPVPEPQEYGSTPCGTCRHIIWEYGNSKTTIICGQYMQAKNGWKFVPKMEKYSTTQLYPKPYKMVRWD